jgi:hypothetical protein
VVGRHLLVAEDLAFLSAGLSPHRVHHVLPYQGSGFANLASEAAVREVGTAAGIAWAPPRNLIVNRFPAVIKHYLLCPVKALPQHPPMPAPPNPAGPPPPSAGARPAPATRRPSVLGQIGELVRYGYDGFRGVGADRRPSGVPPATP